MLSPAFLALSLHFFDIFNGLVRNLLDANVLIDFGREQEIHAFITVLSAHRLMKLHWKALIRIDLSHFYPSSSVPFQRSHLFPLFKAMKRKCLSKHITVTRNINESPECVLFVQVDAPLPKTFFLLAFISTDAEKYRVSSAKRFVFKPLSIFFFPFGGTLFKRRVILHGAWNMIFPPKYFERISKRTRWCW